MVCGLFDIKSLPEPMMTYHDVSWTIRKKFYEILIKILWFSYKKIDVKFICKMTAILFDLLTYHQKDSSEGIFTRYTSEINH